MDPNEANRVAAHYDSPEGQLAPELFGGHVHWGYWDAEHAGDSFAVAADRLTQIMIDRTEVRPGDRFIDIGCGVGGPALKLGRTKRCFVDGITISKFQQESATARAKAEGLQGRLRFIHGDALAIPSPDHAYDGGWFFESIFHMGHAAALREASRVLKPGALLLLTDLPALPHTTDEFRAFADKHTHSQFVTMGDYAGLMADAGFELLGIDDISTNVMSYLVPKLRETIELNRSRIAAAISGDVEKQIDNWLYAFEYYSEQLGYVIVAARKRTDLMPR